MKKDKDKTVAMDKVADLKQKFEGRKQSLCRTHWWIRFFVIMLAAIAGVATVAAAAFTGLAGKFGPAWFTLALTIVAAVATNLGNIFTGLETAHRYNPRWERVKAQEFNLSKEVLKYEEGIEEYKDLDAKGRDNRLMLRLIDIERDAWELSVK